MTHINNEKQYLHSLFFGPEHCVYKQDYPVLTFTPYTKEEDLFESIFPESRRGPCIVQQLKTDEPLNPIKTYSVNGSEDENGLHKKISMEIACPHKDRKHYAKVNA